MIDSELERFIQAIPKAEVHIHLDSISPALLLRIASRNGVELPFTDIDAAHQWYHFRDLDEFLGKWQVTTSVLLTEEDYFDVALELGRDMQAQNILRREAMFTYAAAHEGRVPLETVLAGLARGREAAHRQYGVDLYYTADIDRTISPERSLAYVDAIAPYREEAGILAVGLDCQEVGYPAGAHRQAFERAAEHGFFRSAHAGEEEAAGPQGVWDALRDIGVDRLDHGNQAIRDDALVDYLVEHNVPLGLCPVSNVSINVYPDLAAHPVHALRERGVRLCVNSDDPPFFQANLNQNLVQLAETFGWSGADIVDLARAGFDCSFATAQEKAGYQQRLDAWLAENPPP